MVTQWTKPLPDEKLYVDEQARAHEALRPFNRHAPPPLQGEQLDSYERRLTYEVQRQAPRFKDLNLYEAKGDAYKLLKEQIYADARQEARHPSQIPEGQLRQVTNYDASGRPFYTFYGSPSVWMSQFSLPKKRVVSIMDSRSFQKV